VLENEPIRHYADKHTEGNATGGMIRQMEKREGPDGGLREAARTAALPDCTD
jgi:hypothetical protein